MVLAILMFLVLLIPSAEDVDVELFLRSRSASVGLGYFVALVQRCVTTCFEIEQVVLLRPNNLVIQPLLYLTLTALYKLSTLKI